MTQDNINTRKFYYELYQQWPSRIISIHLDIIEQTVSMMDQEDMIEAQELLGEKLQVWK
jgi:hypothetical protein